MAGARNSIATGKKIAKLGIVLQLACTAVSVTYATLQYNVQIGVAVAFGALAHLLPNAVFSFLAFRISGARYAQAVARNMNQGVRLKLTLAMILLVLAFAVLKLPPKPVLTGFFVSLLAGWSGLFLLGVTNKND